MNKNLWFGHLKKSWWWIVSMIVFNLFYQFYPEHWGGCNPSCSSQLTSVVVRIRFQRGDSSTLWFKTFDEWSSGISNKFTLEICHGYPKNWEISRVVLLIHAHITDHNSKPNPSHIRSPNHITHLRVDSFDMFLWLPESGETSLGVG